jgi:hypothetical protein
MTTTRHLMRALAALVFVALLAACGGGSSGGQPVTPEPPANRSPVASAGAAQTVSTGTAVTLDASASSDPDGDSLSYAWNLVGPAGSTATLATPTTTRPSFTPDLPGTYVATVTVADGRGASASATVSVTATAPYVQPAISLGGQTEPLSGTVKLSLTGTVTGAVEWYADLRLLGSGNAADSNSINWNTVGVTNGEHQLLARIQPTSGSAIDVRRTVTVSTSTVTLNATVSGTTGTINVDVRATSTTGITAVSAKFDGVDAGTLTQPNACSRFCGGSNDVFRFTVDAVRAGSGSHSMVITATDAASGTRSVTVDVPISNAPGLTLSAPLDGALVFGTLRLDGNFTSDKPGAVTVTSKLGDLQILSTTNGNFSGSFDLTGVTPGAYPLTMRATDSTGQVSQIQRNIVVTSSAARAYTPVFTLPTGGQLLAAEGAHVLYTPGDGTVLMRHLVQGTEVTLASASSIQYAAGWRLDGGRAVAFGKGADCVLYCVYLWSTTGAISNLTNANPYSRASNIGGGWAYDLHPVLRGDFVLWVNDKAADTGVATSATGRYTLHQISSGSYTRIGVPAGVNYVGNNEFDFSVSGGVADVWFWGQTGGEGTTSQFDIFRWRSDTGTSTRITSGGSRHIYPQVDGALVAWQQSPIGGSSDGTFALTATALSNVAPSALATKATSFVLRDGVLAWMEAPTTTSKALKASAVGTTRTISSLSTASLLANGGGRVAYGEGGKTYTWASSTGTSTLRLDTAPGQLFMAGGAVVFTVGPSVYRVGVE